MPRLNLPQSRFMTMPHKYRAFVSGFGGGKTWVGCAAICAHAWENPGITMGYFAPTYPQIRDIFYPTIEEVASDWGLKVDIKESNKEVHLFSGAQYRSTIICRSMDKPQNIVGFKIGHAMIDELDVMPAHKAEQAWRKIIARMRYNIPGLRNGVDVTTTPEGFRFTHKRFVKSLRDSPELVNQYGIIQASTYDNAANLPADYIPSLLGDYPPQLIEAYLNGQFTNLSSGTVYAQFSRTENHTDAHIEPGEPLHCGSDFNVLNSTVVVFVVRNGQPMALQELTKVRDTPAMARIISERFAGHNVTVYPDASGQNTSSKNAGESDLTILKQAGLRISVNKTNPAVRDRVNAVNALIMNGDGVRRLLVNTDACPTLTEAFEQQAYAASGEPDKTSGHDHAPDAAGYFLARRWPIKPRFSLDNVI